MVCDLFLSKAVSGASQVMLVVKNPPADAGDIRELGSILGIHWRRAWHSTPVFLPGESQGQRSLVGHSPWGRKESDTTNTYTRDENENAVGERESSGS